MKQSILYIICILCLPQLYKAQLSIAQLGNDRFKVELKTGDNSFANLGITTKQYSATNPGNLVWYEFGDGKFTMQPQFVHSYHPQANVSSSFLKITGLYENGRKPTRIITASSFPRNENINNNQRFEANNSLTNSYNVHVTPNINSVRNDDTMHFAIDYRLPDNRTGWRLVFEYNIDNTNYFKQTSTKKNLTDSYEPNFRLPFIRTHNGEKIATKTNKVIFTNLFSKNNVQTVFVTLETLKQINEDYAEGGVTAYLINEKDKKINPANQHSNAMRGLGAAPHDPNWVKVDKRCVKTKRKAQELNYHVRFQNTGKGNADDIVHVAIKIPQGVLPALFSPANNKFAMQCSGHTVNTFAPFNILTTKTFAPNIAYYDVTTHPDSMHIIIKQPSAASSIILHGMDSSKPNYMDDIKTMGDIKFSVKLPFYPKRTDIYAQAAIIFDTEHSVLTEQEKTKVRNRCKSKDNNCNCEQNKGTKRSFLDWLKEKCG